MFAFVGYIVHANGITWPWPMQLDGTPFPKVSSAPEAWDAISDEAKLQIFAFVGFLEFVSQRIFPFVIFFWKRFPDFLMVSTNLPPSKLISVA